MLCKLAIVHMIQKNKKIWSETKKIHFLIGNSQTVYSIIQDILKNNGVVLTRAWAAAFDYIQGIDEQQAKLLKSIYNSYYNSPIQLRDEVTKPDFTLLRETLLECNFAIPLFDDLDNEKRTTAVAGLSWGTSYKLFTEVFSENSIYMTVHQAKGLEWDKVIISVIPNKFDKIKLSALYSKPQLMNENPADEFTRMYDVACSRAKEDLYIHISDKCLIPELQASINAYIEKNRISIAYEFIQ